MQFVLVNERMPRGFSVCAWCSQPFGAGYLRDVSSGRVYCSLQCCRSDREAGDWSFDRSGHLVRLAAPQSGLYVDWAAPSPRQ